jgi:hypothetical protein
VYIPKNEKWLRNCLSENRLKPHILLYTQYRHRSCQVTTYHVFLLCHLRLQFICPLCAFKLIVPIQSCVCNRHIPCICQIFQLIMKVGMCAYFEESRKMKRSVPVVQQQLSIQFDPQA